MAIQKTNSLAINSVKNLAQFAVGFGLTVATFGYVFDLQRVVLAALSLLFIYLASYLYNDITDLAEDKKDPFKLRFKPLARGELKVETAKKLMGVLYALGFALAFFLGQEFLIIVAMISMLNFVYSSPYIRYKNDDFTFTVSIFLMEFFKFTAGWLGGVGSFEKFPLVFVASISLLYIVFGRAYKKKLRTSELFQDRVIVAASVAGLLLYLLSIKLYDFRFQMLVSPLLFIFVFIPWAIYSGKEKLFERIFYTMIFAVFVLFIISAIFFATPLGIFNAINNKIAILLAQL